MIDNTHNDTACCNIALTYSDRRKSPDDVPMTALQLSLLQPTRDAQVVRVPQTYPWIYVRAQPRSAARSARTLRPTRHFTAAAAISLETDAKLTCDGVEVKASEEKVV